MKNEKLLLCKPLLAYSIEIAAKIKSIDKVFVSTEDQKIASIAKKWGANVIKRPKNLAMDNSPEWLAWEHAIDWVEDKGERFDIMISLPATSPLRNENDVMACLQKLDKKTDVVVTITSTTRSPWFNMVREKENGFIELVSKSDKIYTRRQDTPIIYDMTTVAYVTRPKYIKKAKSVFEGKVKGVMIPIERALDIDTDFDFKIAEFLLS